MHKNRTAPALASHATNLRNAANFRYVAAAFPARQHFPRRYAATILFVVLSYGIWVGLLAKLNLVHTSEKIEREFPRDGVQI